MTKRFFRKGMMAKVHPSLTCDPAGFRGKVVKVLKVHNELAKIQHGKKIGYYEVDTLLKVRKKSGK